MHLAVVLDVHAVVAHEESTRICPVGVKLWAPKFNPWMATMAPPDAGVFHGTDELATGASKVHDKARVPAIAPTVTTPCPTLSDLGTTILHATVVADVQDVVLQASDASTAAAVGVNAYEPKLRPEMVTDPALLAAKFLAAPTP